MKNNEKMYVIIFDKHANFKEIHVLSKSSDPFVVNPKSVGDSIYIYTQKEFAKLIGSAIRYLTEPVDESDDSHSNDNDIFANASQQVILPDGSIGYIKSVKDGSTKYINIDKPLPVSKKGYLKYYKAPTGTFSDSSSAIPASNKSYLKYYKALTSTCSDSSSAMPTEAGATDATKTIKKAPEEYRSDGDGKIACTLTEGVDINPKIEINGAEVSKKIFDDFLKAGSK